jgi:transposase-like protein
MEGRQRRSFTDDYKRRAVDLVASSGRSIGSVAKELGLRDSVLRRWVEQRGAGLEPTAAGANRLEASVQDPWTSWGLHTRQGSQVHVCR